jgi:hypothetical protein
MPVKALQEALIRYLGSGIWHQIEPNIQTCQLRLLTRLEQLYYKDMFVYFLFAIAVFLLMPTIAHAWGPGTHVEIATTAIAKASLAIPPIRALLKKYPDDFIYGASAPDIILGKKLAGYMHHCHNWRMGWLILNEATSDRARAGAYGYLMHLAADIVAHNYYIPFKIIRSYESRLMSHTYWEMRFDLGVKDETWRRLDKLVKHDFKEFDNLLNRVLKKTIFSFKTNKRIYSGILALQKLSGLRKSLQAYAKRSRFAIGEENRQHYMDLAIEAALNFLADPEGAPCLNIDPTGEARIAYAKILRRRFKVMRELGQISEEEAVKVIELIKECLALALYQPNMTLPDVVDVL